MGYPPIWGPDLHGMLLLMAFRYPRHPSDLQKSHMSQLIHYLFEFLPCPGCTDHALEYIGILPPNVSSSDELVQWLVDFHNSINQRLGKRCNWTAAEAKNALVQRYFTNVHELSNAQFIRLEDARTIQELRNQLAVLSTDQTTQEGDETLNILIQTLEQQAIDARTNIREDMDGRHIVDAYNHDTISIVLLICILIVVIVLTIFVIMNRG